MTSVCKWLAAMLALWAVTAFGDGYSVDVGTNIIKVVPSGTVDSAPAWAVSNAYTQGAYVETSEGRLYMALVPGTSGATEPYGRPLVTDGTNGLVWVNCRSPRLTVSITVDMTNGPVYVSPGGNMPTVPAGHRLNAGGGNLILTGSDAKAEVTAATASGTNRLVVAHY